MISDSDNFSEEGDCVIVLCPPKYNCITLKRGQVFANNKGRYPHEILIGVKFGSKVVSSCVLKGSAFLLKFTPNLWCQCINRRTQILFPTDISLILFYLNLKPGSIVVESGTGSGLLSHFIADKIQPNGMLHTFEVNEERYNEAISDFKLHKIDHVIKIEKRDVYKEGFGLKEISDAIFLDLPEPWKVIKYAYEALNTNDSILCSFSPCIEQVKKVVLELENYSFSNIRTVECLQREMKILLDKGSDKTLTSLNSNATGHTGFLTFASK